MDDKPTSSTAESRVLASKDPGDRAASSEHARPISRGEARSGLRRLQIGIGAAFLVSAAAGVFLLATDGSLWLLAFSHAIGLVVVVLIDLVLGFLNLRSMKNVYLPSLAAAVLGLLLQLGDIITAPQYNMTIQYFASYLFGLWAFDLVLFLQVLIVSLGVVGRGYAQYLAGKRSRRKRELVYSRRSFVKAIIAFAGLIGMTVALGSVKIPPPGASSRTSQSGLPNGAIANINSLQTVSPVYFEYPSGYPNILVKKDDNSLVALSALCTHVCCECSYDGGSNVIYCPCHGSVFDLNGNVLRGPAFSPLPKVELNVDAQGNVFPVKVSGSSPCAQF